MQSPSQAWSSSGERSTTWAHRPVRNFGATVSTFFSLTRDIQNPDDLQSIFFNFLILPLKCRFFFSTSSLVIFHLYECNVLNHKLFKLQVWCHPTLTPPMENSSTLFHFLEDKDPIFHVVSNTSRIQSLSLANLTGLLSCTTADSLLFSKFPEGVGVSPYHQGQPSTPAMMGLSHLTLVTTRWCLHGFSF